MAIQFTDFSKIAPQKAPFADVFESALKGYQMEEAPKQIALEQKKSALANALQEKALAHKDKEYSLADSLAQAKINAANRPASTKLNGALAQAFELRKQFPEGSKEYEQVTNYINKLGTSANGVQISGTPGGGFEISVGGQGETASIPGLPKLRVGETYLFDENKTPIGIGKPYSEAEKKEVSGREAFNIYQKFITDAQAPYSGKGSTRQFEDDVRNYESDAAAKDRIDKLLAADKLLFSATVKEEATLGGANTNQAYNRITNSLQNSEVYPLLKKIAKYQLPQGYAKSSSDIFSNVLNQGTEAGHKVPAYKPYYFDVNRSKSKPTASPAQSSSGFDFSKFPVAGGR